MAEIHGGDKFNRALAEISKRVTKAATVRVGFLSDATYPDGTPVALVAATQNFGSMSQGIPPRPFFTNMVADKSSEWGDKLARLLEANDYDVEKALALMGQGIAGQLRQAITDTNAPPLAPETVRRKGFDKPLVDTGHMLASVDSEVVE